MTTLERVARRAARRRRHPVRRVLDDDRPGERKTDLTEFWIVDRKSIAWPPEPISACAKSIIHRGLQLWDVIEEAGLRRTRTP